MRGRFGVVVTLAAAVGFPAVLVAQGPAAAEIRRLDALFQEARAEAVHLLAPRAFEEALDRFDDARRRAADPPVGEDFRDRVRQSESRLAAARDLARDARVLLARALAARADAVEADASGRAPGPWETAEAELREAGRRFQRNDREEAVERADRAVELYRRAALAAWRERSLGAAIQARQRALSLGAQELAPRTFAAGEQALETGEGRLAEEPRSDAVSEAGRRSLAAFQRAAELSALADSVLRRRVPVERLLLGHEADLARLAEAAGIAPVSGSPDETTAAIAAEIARLRADVARLNRALEESRSVSAGRAERIAELEEELAASESRYAEARSELLARRARDERLLEASALFSTDEGEVFVRGDQLTIRLYGLTFDTGSAEIPGEDGALLTKVQRVITAFENARIRIEGHTDSRGRPEANEALSLRRAIAVREHLLARLPIPSSRIEAVGYGESRPIASNETEEGRRRNRRIEISLNLSGG